MSFRLAVLLLLCGPAPAALHAQVFQEAVTPFMNATSMREMARDDDGVLWISSNGGLLGFDPATRDWTTYPRMQFSGPSGNDCVTLSRGDDGLIWIGSGTQGVSSYDPALDRWSFFEEVPSLETRVVRALGDQVFVGTQAGLSLRFQPNRTEICNDINVSCLVPSFVVNGFAKTGDSLWVATQEGLGLYDGSGWVPLDQLPVRATNQNVSSMVSYGGELWAVIEGIVFRLVNGEFRHTSVAGKTLKVSNGTLYMMREESVAKWSGSRWEEQGGVALPGDGIRDLEEVDGAYYLATANGLARWEGGDDVPVFFYPPGPATASSYFGITADSEGTVWVVNPRGLLSYRETDWDFLSRGAGGLDNEWGAAVLAAGPDLVVGHCCCNNPPRCRTDIGDGEQFSGVDVYDAWALTYDDQWVWAATNTDGVHILEESGGEWFSGRHLTTFDTPLLSNTVSAVAVDANEAWFGHLGEGISYWRHDGNLDGGFWSSITTLSSLLDNNVNVMVKNGNDLWVGTSTGIHRVQGEIVLESRRTTFFDVIGDRPRSVRAIVIDDLDNVWMGTDDGLLVWEPNQLDFRHLHVGNSNLPSDNVFSGTYNPADGSVWFGCEEGIVRVDPRRALGVKPSSVPYAVYPNPYNPRPVVGGSETAQDVILADVSSGVPVNPEFSEDTPVEVLDISGTVVGAFTFDGKWRWNGLSQGQPVAPGLYVVRARPAGREAILLKLGVIR